MINGVSVSHPSSSCYIHVSQDSRSPDKFSLTKSVLDSVSRPVAGWSVEVFARLVFTGASVAAARLTCAGQAPPLFSQLYL